MIFYNLEKLFCQLQPVILPYSCSRVSIKEVRSYHLIVIQDSSKFPVYLVRVWHHHKHITKYQFGNESFDYRILNHHLFFFLSFNHNIAFYHLVVMWEERIEFTLTVCLCADRSANKLKRESVTKWLTVITLTSNMKFM